MTGLPVSAGLLIVVGEVPELSDEMVAASILRVQPDFSAELPRPSVAVFDLRASTLAHLVLLRSHRKFDGVPLLLVSSAPVDERVLDELGADDEWNPGAAPSLLRRRLGRLLDLDRLRKNLWREVGRLERQILDRQRFDHSILDGVEVGIVTTDRDGTITFLNRAATDLLGPERAVHGAEVGEVLGLPDTPGALLSGEVRRVLGYELPLSGAPELDLQLVVSRGDAADDDRVGFFFIFHDVREQKRLEEDRRRFERLAAMGTMVAGFAHEVRNPVAAMRSITEQLRDELVEEGLETPHVSMLLRLIARVERLVRTSLQFGRPAAPKKARRRPSAIVELAVADLALHQRAAAEGRVVVDVESDLPDVDVDDRQIAQALVILLHNAIDSTGDASRVTLRAARVHRQEPDRRRSEPPYVPSVRFVVVDDGPGVPPDLVDRIFDPFFTTKPAGTGLGLSIAQQLVSENGGRLEVISPPGGLTCFSVIVVASASDPPSEN